MIAWPPRPDAAAAAPPAAQGNGPTASSRRLQFLLLLGLTLLIAAMRWHTFDEPRERDLDLYAWIGHYLFHGRALYSDLVEIKPPLPYILYGLAELITGLGQRQVYLLGVLASGTTMLGLFWLGARVLGRSWLGLGAAFFWVLLSSDLYLQANQPNTEVFINMFFVWGLAALCWLPQDRLRAGASVAIGLLFACATLCKTVALVPACCVIGAKLLLGASDLRRRAFSQACIMLAAIILCWAAMLAWMAAQGSLGIALHVLFVYPREYAAINGGNVLTNIVDAFAWPHLAPGFFAVQALGVALCAAAAMLAVPSADRTIAALMLCWMCGIFLAVALPGHFYPHYYQLWLPWLAFALALLVDWTTRRLAAPNRIRGLAIALIGAGWSVFWLVPQYRLSADQWSMRKYGGQFIDARAVGRELRTRLRPGQRLFVFGMFPGIYAEAGREPFTGVLALWLVLPRIGGSLSVPLGQRVLGQLERAPPDVIVLDGETWALTQPGEPIRDWIASRYRVEGNSHHFAIAVPASTAQ